MLRSLLVLQLLSDRQFREYTDATVMQDQIQALYLIL